MDKYMINTFGLTGYKIMIIAIYIPLIAILWAIAIKFIKEIFKKGEL